MMLGENSVCPMSKTLHSFSLPSLPPSLPLFIMLYKVDVVLSVTS